jgi:hypothetical protein
MKHTRRNVVCTARDTNGTHFPSRLPTQEGSAVKWSRTRDKSPLFAASMMSGLPLMRAAAAACKTNEIGAREWSCTIDRKTRQQTPHLPLHGGMHGYQILQRNRVSNSSVRGKRDKTCTSCCAVSTAAAAAGMACSNGGARVRKRDMQALRVVQWHAMK